jgi:hypothetical protein
MNELLNERMNEIAIAISIGALAVVITEVSGIMQWMKYKFNIQRRIKPFDCEKCLGFWLGIIYFLPHCQLSIVNYQLFISWLAMSAVASVSAILILKQIRK